jgi:hypothetical protein
MSILFIPHLLISSLHFQKFTPRAFGCLAQSDKPRSSLPNSSWMCNFELLHSTCMSGILSLYISLNISYMVFVYAEVRSWWLTFSAWPWEYDLMWFIRILLRHDLSIGVLFIRGRNDINNGFLAILPGHLDNHLRL